MGSGSLQFPFFFFWCKRTFSICSLLLLVLVLLVLFSLSRLVTGSSSSSSSSRRWGRLACLGQVFSHYACFHLELCCWLVFFFRFVFWGFTPPQLELHPRRVHGFLWQTNRQTNKQASKQRKFFISLCVCRGGARRKQHLRPLVSFSFIHVFVAWKSWQCRLHAVFLYELFEPPVVLVVNTLISASETDRDTERQRKFVCAIYIMCVPGDDD